MKSNSPNTGLTITKARLPSHARRRVCNIVGERGNAAKLIAAVEKDLRYSEGAERSTPSSLKKLRNDAKSFGNHAATLSKELRYYVNFFFRARLASLGHLKGSDAEALKAVDWVENIEQACENVAKLQRDRRDLFAKHIVVHLARHWQNHTTLKLSAAPAARFVKFVAVVLQNCTDWKSNKPQRQNDSDSKGSDPRRLIESALALFKVQAEATAVQGD